MKTYPIPMVPGPVSVPQEILNAYTEDFGSSDLEPEFLELYQQTEAQLQTILATQNQVAILSGEGMLALWAALKSCLKPGDRVLAVGTGVFGYGIGDMARAIGAEVKTVGYEYDQTLPYDLSAVEAEIVSFQPKMITAVHCETPSGTLNPLGGLGQLKEMHGVPLFYVDAVASLAGAPVLTDEWKVDLMLGGTQKALSAPAGMSFVAISPRAWQVITEVAYPGYDALLPFRTAVENFYFPYTPYWHGLAALNVAARRVLDEGLEAAFARHEMVAHACRTRLVEMGYELFPAADAICAPTVTAVKVPTGIPWEQFDASLRAGGLAVGGSYGPLAGKVFRLGHMGAQADMELLDNALKVLKQAVI